MTDPIPPYMAELHTKISGLSEHDAKVALVRTGMAMMLAIDYLKEFGRDGYDVSEKIAAVWRIAKGEHA